MRWCSAKASEEVVRAARSTAERAYQKDAQIARLEAALKESEDKLHQYQSAAGELEGQCQDQAAEISDLQAQLDGALADEEQASLSLVGLCYDHFTQVVESRTA